MLLIYLANAYAAVYSSQIIAQSSAEWILLKLSTTSWRTRLHDRRNWNMVHQKAICRWEQNWERTQVQNSHQISEERQHSSFWHLPWWWSCFWQQIYNWCKWRMKTMQDSISRKQNIKWSNEYFQKFKICLKFILIKKNLKTVKATCHCVSFAIGTYADIKYKFRYRMFFRSYFGTPSNLYKKHNYCHIHHAII